MFPIDFKPTVRAKVTCIGRSAIRPGDETGIIDATLIIEVVIGASASTLSLTDLDGGKWQ